MSDLNESLASILAAMPQRLILSKQTNKSQLYRKVTIERIEQNTGDYYQIAKYTEKQVFHENCTPDELTTHLREMLGEQFLQLNAWSAGAEHQILMSKKGTVTYKKKVVPNAAQPKTSGSHNRKKTICCRRGIRFLRSSIWESLQRKARSSIPCTTNSARSTGSLN